MAAFASSYTLVEQVVAVKPWPIDIGQYSVARTVIRPHLMLVEPKTFIDLPQHFPNKSVGGYVYLPDNTPAPNVPVKMFRQYDDQLIAQTTTDTNGFYVFVRDQNDTNAYYVVAFTADQDPQIHGVSDRGVVPA